MKRLQLIWILDNKQFTCLNFIDHAKVFDTFNHSIIIDKLYNYVLRGLPAKLIQNCLTDRTQITMANSNKSNPIMITCGVPQGSILGPILFLIYVNDLPNVSLFNVKLFADTLVACLLYDSKFPTSLESSVNKELVKINDWIKFNQLSINYSKINYIIFTEINEIINLNLT